MEESSLSKRETMERLLKVWEANPHLRLGQLLAHATRKVNFSYLYDDELVRLVELFLPPKKRVRRN